MFNKVLPEQVGIKSEWIESFITKLNTIGLPMHDVVIMRGYDIFCEAFWKPYNKDCLHRQYSQTKSFVSLAIGLLEEEKKLNLNDKICNYFKDEIKVPMHPYLKELTIEDMLKMTTCGQAPYWFYDDNKDRSNAYFNNNNTTHPSNTSWAYESKGSQDLCELVEKLAKMPLLDYLKEKIFNDIGAFKNAKTLTVPTGETWGDSSLICSPYDMLVAGKLVMNYGTFKGKRYLNEDYLKKATSPLVDCNDLGHMASDSFGYGYQIWCFRNNSFGFSGMGQQFTICNPEKDIVLVCNSDIQGSHYNYNTLINYFFDEIVEKIDKDNLKENKKANKRLNNLLKSLKLYSLKGKTDSPIKEFINNKTYLVINKNSTGITKFSIKFNKNGGILSYTNAQGKKKLPFKFNENLYGKFPQLGYNNQVGGVPTTDGFMFNCATSACFATPNKLKIFVQIIDEYLGNATFNFNFKENYCYLIIRKCAEGFLDEYYGEVLAEIKW